MNIMWTHSVAGMMMLTAMGQVIGFVREAVFAAYFGISSVMDAYVVATQIPITLFAVVGVSLTTTILPIYTKKLKQNQAESDFFISNIMSIIGVISFTFAVLGILLAEHLVFMFAPRFDEPTRHIAILLTRILFPTVMMTSIINIIVAVLNAWRVFLLPLIFGQIQNIILILGVIFFYDKFGIYAAAWASVIGILINTLCLFPFLKGKFKYKLVIDIKDESVSQVVKLVIPVSLGIGIAEVNRIIDRSIASGLVSGSISAISYASRLSTVFNALILGSLSTVAYQSLTHLFVNDKREEIVKRINSYLAALAVMIFPIMGGLIIFSHTIIKIVFARGAFGGSATVLTQEIFIFYIIGMIFTVERELISKVYYAMNDTKTPMYNAAISTVINIILNFILAKFMGPAGLALATSISMAVCTVLMLRKLYGKIEGFTLSLFIKMALRSFIITIIMVVGLHWFQVLFPIENEFLNLFICAFIGVVFYFAVLLCDRTADTTETLSVIFSRLNKVDRSNKDG